MRFHSILGTAILCMAVGFVAGCGDDEEGVSLGDCPANSTADQTEGHTIVKNSCLSCHSTALTGSARNGSPADSNFDDFAWVRGEPAEIYGRVKDGSMPPGTGLPAPDQEKVRIWLACGAQDL